METRLLDADPRRLPANDLQVAWIALAFTVVAHVGLAVTASGWRAITVSIPLAAVLVMAVVTARRFRPVGAVPGWIRAAWPDATICVRDGDDLPMVALAGSRPMLVLSRGWCARAGVESAGARAVLAHELGHVSAREVGVLVVGHVYALGVAVAALVEPTAGANALALVTCAAAVVLQRWVRRRRECFADLVAGGAHLVVAHVRAYAPARRSRRCRGPVLLLVLLRRVISTFIRTDGVAYRHDRASVDPTTLLPDLGSVVILGVFSALYTAWALLLFDIRVVTTEESLSVLSHPAGLLQPDGVLLAGAVALRSLLALLIWIPVLANPLRRSGWWLGLAFLAGWLGAGTALGELLDANLVPSPGDLVVFAIARVLFFSSERDAARAAASASSGGVAMRRLLTLAAVEPLFLTSALWLAYAGGDGLSSIWFLVQRGDVLAMALVVLAFYLVSHAVRAVRGVIETPYVWVLAWAYLFHAAALLGSMTFAEHLPWPVLAALAALLYFSLHNLHRLFDEHDHGPKLAFLALQVAAIVIAPVATGWRDMALIAGATPAFWLGFLAILVSSAKDEPRAHAPVANRIDPAVVTLGLGSLIAVSISLGRLA